MLIFSTKNILKSPYVCALWSLFNVQLKLCLRKTIDFMVPWHPFMQIETYRFKCIFSHFRDIFRYYFIKLNKFSSPSSFLLLSSPLSLFLYKCEYSFTWCCPRGVLNYSQFLKLFFFSLRLGILPLLRSLILYIIPLYHLLYYWFLLVYLLFQLLYSSAVFLCYFS